MKQQAIEIGSALLVELRNFAEELADASGPLIMRHFRSALQVEDKGGAGYDPVTVADKATERLMRELILVRYPGQGILGEEEAEVSGRSPLVDRMVGDVGPHMAQPGLGVNAAQLGSADKKLLHN